MKLDELSKEARKHAFYYEYGAETMDPASPAEATYSDLIEEMRDIITAYCEETGTSVRTRRTWGSLFYDFELADTNKSDKAERITLASCDSDNAYALAECYNSRIDDGMTAREANRIFARLVVDYDDGNADYAYSWDAFESWAYGREFDGAGNLIS